MMKSIIKMISAFFLLSLFNILGSQARMLPAGEYKDWISMVAEQIITSSSMIKKPTQPPPPAPGSSQPETGMIKRPIRPLPPAAGASPPKIGLSNYRKAPASPPPAPYTGPTIGQTILTATLKPEMSDLGKTGKPPPPPPITSPTIDDIISSTTNRLSVRSPPPHDIWIADC